MQPLSHPLGRYRRGKLWFELRSLLYQSQLFHNPAGGKYQLPEHACQPSVLGLLVGLLSGPTLDRSGLPIFMRMPFSGGTVKETAEIGVVLLMFVAGWAAWGPAQPSGVAGHWG
jgi:hypothetical protein